MASKDENVIEFPSKGKGDNKGNKKPKSPKGKKSMTRTIGWIAGIVILILISITFVLPTTIFSSSNGSSYTFGKYNGEKITLEYGNYFYLTLNNIYNMYAQIFGGTVPQGMEFSIYYQAFQQSAVYTALSQMAEKAKIKPSTAAITEAEISSGYWMDENGNFDTEKYAEATSFQKQNVTNLIALQYPITLVTTDIMNAKVSENEASFIQNMSSNGKSFEYLVVDSTLLPDEVALSYGESNPMPFTSKELSMLSFLTEEAALEKLSALNSGTTTFIDETTLSLDPYAPMDGKMGTVSYSSLQNTLYSDANAVDEVFSSSTGSLLGPYQTQYGYSIIKTDSDPILPNFNDVATLSSVKSYMSTNDTSTMLNYLSSIANDIYEIAQSDFSKAEEDYDLMVGTVNNVVENPSSSSYLPSLTSSDRYSYLANALSSDPDYQNRLFNAPVGTILEPLAVNNVYIISRSIGEADSANTTNYALNYTNGAGENSLEDYQESILSSDKLEDNFIETYQKIMNTSI